MAKSRKEPSSTPPSLPPGRAAQLLRAQVDRGGQLLANRPITSSANQAWETVTRDVLSRAFGSDSPNVSSVMDVGKYGFMFGSGNEQEWESARATNMTQRLEIVRSLIEMLESESEGQPSYAAGPMVVPGGNLRLSGDTVEARRRVFLVHGHDDAAKQATARLLERLGLEVTILHEKANEGRTIIEKFEGHSDVHFAVVLLTADDRGATANTPYKDQKLRARQNVILEFGFFLGKLGRRNVCALYADGVELPSDYNGVIFVPLDAKGAWHLALARELKAAGLDVDLNKAM